MLAFQDKRLAEALILVVDDIEVNRRMLSHSLMAHGYRNIIMASDGSEALDMTTAHRPDLVILDLMMPGMDGFAYCQQVRQNKQFDSMPIIVQTALHEMEEKLKAFKYGASDYICKPIDPGELSARTQVHLNQKLLMADLQAYQSNMMAELDSARQMQDRLMPADHLIQSAGRMFNMRIAHHFETSFALGGDCWGMRPLSETRLALYIFDFSGHGMTSAMNVFRMHSIIQDLMLTASEPGHFLTRLNQQLYPLLRRDEIATMFYGIIDTDANCLVYASAAAPLGMVCTQNSTQTAHLQGRGFPLGAIPNANYETKYSPFLPGDLLVLHSDCITETKNQAGDFLSEAQLQSEILAAWKTRPDPARSAVENLLKLLRSHSVSPLTDDNTITAYWRCPDPAI